MERAWARLKSSRSRAREVNRTNRPRRRGGRGGQKEEEEEEQNLGLRGFSSPGNSKPRRTDSFPLRDLRVLRASAVLRGRLLGSSARSRRARGAGEDRLELGLVREERVDDLGVEGEPALLAQVRRRGM